MGKYALLLQQLTKAVTSGQEQSASEITDNIEQLQKAEEMVRFQLRHGNDLLAMDSLRDCDVSLDFCRLEAELISKSVVIVNALHCISGECKRARSPVAAE